ncbi:MAG: hypothetical protein AAGE80_01645 [Pseudomonadota bacterium]
MSEATLRRIDRAAMQAVALVVMGVMITRLMLVPAMAEARDGQIVICGAGGMAVVSVAPGEAPEPVDDPAHCAEHCALTVEFSGCTADAALDSAAWSAAKATFAPWRAVPVAQRPFRPRAPPLTA